MRTAGILGGLAGAEIVLSLLLQWWFLRMLGPGAATDALYAGMMVPQLVLIVLTGSLIQVLVPLLAVQDDAGYAQSVWTFVHLTVLGFGGLALLGILAAGAWVPLTVPGFDAAGRALTVHLVRIQLLGLLLAALASMLWIAHQARGRFLRCSISPLVATTAGFAALVWGLPRYGVSAAAWVSVLRAGVQVAILLPGLGWYRRPRWRTAVTAEAWRRLRPLLSRSFYFKADVVVDRFLAGLAPSGSLSLLTLARQVYTAGHQVMNRAVTAPAIPALAHLAEQGEWAAFRRKRNTRARWATLVAAAGLLLLVVAGRPVLSLFFAGSRFSPEQIGQTWGFLLVLGGVWVAGVTSQVLAGAFYAQGDTETPTRIGVISFTVGVGLKVVGFFALGVWGIAAGASAHYLLMSALLWRAGGHPRPAAETLLVAPPGAGSADALTEGDFEVPAVAAESPRGRR